MNRRTFYLEALSCYNLGHVKLEQSNTHIIGRGIRDYLGSLQGILHLLKALLSFQYFCEVDREG